MGILLFLCCERLRDVFLQALDDETHGETPRLLAGTANKATRKVILRKLLTISSVYIIGWFSKK